MGVQSLTLFIACTHLLCKRSRRHSAPDSRRITMKTNNFADLANMQNGMRASEPSTAEPKPKRPKQKRKAPTGVQWQPLADMDHPLPNRLQVHLRLGKHPKTGGAQWFGFYEHGQQRLKVVCDPYWQHQLPAGGEIWEVRVTKQIPGIIFATAEESMARKQMLEADEHVVLVETLERDDKPRSYHTPHYFVTARSVADSQIRVRMEIPLDVVPPRPGETWKVRKIGRSSYLPLSVEPIELIGEMAQWPMDEFSVALAWDFEDPCHPDDGSSSYEPEFITGKYEGWQVFVVNRNEISFISEEVWFVEVVNVSLETRVLEVRALRPVIDVEGTEAMLTTKLVMGHSFSVYPEVDEEEHGVGSLPKGEIRKMSWSSTQDGYHVILDLRRGYDSTTRVDIWGVRKFTDPNDRLKGFVFVDDVWERGRQRELPVELWVTKPRF